MGDIADLIGIISALLAIAFFIYPETRAWLESKVEIFRSSTCLAIMIFSSVFILMLITVPRTYKGVKTWLATQTPTPTITPTRTPLPTSTPIPTATLVPTPAYSYLVADNFHESPLPFWLIRNGTWTMINDRYTLANVKDGTDWTYGLSFIGDPSWTDYELGASIHLVNIHPEINAVYLIVRAQNFDNFLMLEIRDYDFLDSDWSRGRWYVIENGQKSEYTAAGFPSPLTTDFSIRIQVQGDIITTFVDNQQVSRFGTVPFLNGMTGVGVSSRYSTDPAAFESFYVRTLP